MTDYTIGLIKWFKQHEPVMNAFLAGKKIQRRCLTGWADCNPEWITDHVYRVKPEPTVRYVNVYLSIKSQYEYYSSSMYKTQDEAVAYGKGCSGYVRTAKFTETIDV